MILCHLIKEAAEPFTSIVTIIRINPYGMVLRKGQGLSNDEGLTKKIRLRGSSKERVE